jgi:segregation and condensation protein B
MADDDDAVAQMDDDAVQAADERLLGILESVLFAAGEPLSLVRLGETVPGASRAELRAALGELMVRGEREHRGIRLVEVANGYQFRTDPAHAEWVRRLFQQKPWRLTRATLETLAIVAYKQPITRAEIETIRGVDVDGVLASLLSRKLVKIVGRKDVIGRPLLYGTTRQFLEVFGLRDLAGLPALTEVAVAAPEAVGAGAAATDATWSGDDSGSEIDGDPTAEMAGGRGDLLATSGGGADSPGSGEAERPHRDGARDPGERA